MQLPHWRPWRDRPRVERELDAELRDHLDRLTAAHLSAGLPPQEARRRAMLAFGGLAQVKEACRDERSGAGVDATMQDFRIAARVLWRQRGFAAAVIVTLALGLGASAAIARRLPGRRVRCRPYEGGPSCDRASCTEGGT